MLPILQRNIHAKVLAEDVLKKVDEIKLLLAARTEAPIRKHLNVVKSEMSAVLASVDNHLKLLMVDIDIILSKDFESPVDSEDQEFKASEL
jgi:hypothetical protein